MTKTPKAHVDPAHGAFAGEEPALDAIFAPQSVAVIGATDRPGSVGRALMWNLVSNPFGGVVYPINPGRESVLGIRAYPHVAATPGPVDLAVIATPAAGVPEVVAECVAARVKGAVIISAGFRECGAHGAALEQKVLVEAKRGGLRIVGPNCLGIMRPKRHLNVTFAAVTARPGHIAFLSQSGALGTAILDWSLSEDVGFSIFASLGSMLDVGWGDLIDYLGDDPDTRSIVLYMESIGDARAFLSAAREAALSKPIIVLKSGRAEVSARAVLSHTGSMSGSDDVLDAAFRRSGVLRVDTIEELFAMAEVLDKQPRPRGPRLTVLTNAGGPGVLAADALIAAGGTLASLPTETMNALNQTLPAAWSHGNPIDILGDSDPARYAKAVEIAAANPDSDGLLVILTPQAMTDPAATAERLAAASIPADKPLLASWMGGDGVAGGRAILNGKGMPAFAYPDMAARTFQTMWQYTQSLRLIYETPSLPPDPRSDGPHRATAEAIIQAARGAGRTVLTEAESKQILAAYGIPVVETHIAATEDDAITLAEKVGYPVVVKIHSQTITHKTDVDGVKVGLNDGQAVRAAFQAIETAVRNRLGAAHFCGVTVQPMITGEGYELLVGSSVDAQFGPVLLFGTGGILTGLYRDRSLALPPINSTLAQRLMERTKVYAAFQGMRGRKPVPIEPLEHLLVRFGQLVVEQPWIRELDINPLFASPERLIALDARMVLHGAEMTPERLPGPVIRPYPECYVGRWILKNGTPVTIRPIRPEDEPLYVKFHESLSERSIYYRFFHMTALSQRIAHERLTRVCFIDYDREIALVAEKAAADGSREITGVGRLRKVPHTDKAQFALLVSDHAQNQGLGTELLSRLIHVAKDEKLTTLCAQIHPENREMIRVCDKVGGASACLTGSVIRVEIDVAHATATPASPPDPRLARPSAEVNASHETPTSAERARASEVKRGQDGTEPIVADEAGHAT
jgi:acetyltransferase